MSQGRERRRRGVVNRLRRLAYGLVLTCSLPVTAGQLVPDAATANRGGQAAPQRLLLAGLEGVITLSAVEPADAATPLGTDDDYGNLHFEDIALELDDPRAGSTLRMTLTPAEKLRDGLGLQLDIPDLGALHLNLYARRNAQTPGKRWTWSPDPDRGGADPGAWSLGGSMELVRTADGSRRVTFVPELTVDGDALLDRAVGFSAAVRYAHWRSLGEKDAEELAVPQLLFRWKI